MRGWYGFALSLVTAVLWGMLPVGMVLLLGRLDVVTITWSRFAFCSVCVGLWLYRRRLWPARSQLAGSMRWFLALAVLGLLGNFLLYLLGLRLLNPEATQTIIQLAPILLLFGSVYFNGEKLSALEWSGALLLVAGLALFFNQKLAGLMTSLGSETVGVLCMLAAALSWSIYGLVQKRLMRSLNSLQVTLLIYGAGTVVLLPFVVLPSLAQLDGLQASALLFCCLNMLVGYGAFTEAMRIWQAAKVSAVIALAPVFTILSMKLAVWLMPAHFVSSELNTLAYLGALTVVAGSMLAALGKQPAVVSRNDAHE
ncbi:MAG TPA: DMT family transporter [Candidatus Acidoferrum sp.]|nr:DMT family transporter [Candidatus Acidoferrum sp.]